MTPMVDVVLLLMIFFLYTSQLTQVLRTEVDLPNEAGEIESEDRPGAIVIDLHADGTIYVQAEPTSMSQLLDRIDLAVAAGPSAIQDLDLLIRPDKTSSARLLNTLAAELSSRGITTWRLGTAPAR